MTRRGLAVVGLAALVACGGGGTGYGVFSTNWNDDDGKSIDEVEKKLAGVPIPLGADVAVGVAGHGSRLVGAPLAGGSRWSFAHAIDARPVVAGGVVVGSGGNEVFAVDALTGKLLWHLPTGGLALHGAGDDGTVSVVTMSRAAGRGSTLLAVAHDGMVLRQIDPSVSLGAPAVVNRIAFVPWDNQYVSALDVTDGAEVGRLLLREKTSHAWTSGGALYFGELGLFRFDAKIKNASRGGADHVALPAKALPGHPVLFQPGDRAVAASSGAADKVRLYARPTAPTEVLAIADGRFYATYFRLLYGLTVSPRAALSWVHTHADAIVGGAAAAGGFIACDEAGKVTTFDAGTGATLGGVIDLGEPVESCVVSADGLRATGAPHDALPLVEQIRVALADRDLELGAGQALLLRELGELPDEAGTAVLLGLATDPHLAATVREDVRAALATRRSGAPAMIAALGKHYDFLHDVLVPPPVAPLARALLAMNIPSAAPALARHLFDPADTDEDVRDVALALATLAGPSEVPDLLRFFALYRDAPEAPEAIPQAVGAVAEAIVRLGGAPGRAAIDAAIRQPATNATVRAKLTALLEAASVQRAAPSIKPSSTSRE